MCRDVCYTIYEFDSEIVSDLCDALSQFAPAYCYFGAHEGDGADFGFWPSFDSLRESDALRVAGSRIGICFDDTSEVPADYSGEVIHVNDHGNMTLYVAECAGTGDLLVMGWTGDVFMDCSDGTLHAQFYA